MSGPASPQGQQHGAFGHAQQPGEGLPRPGTHAAAARLAFTPPQARQQLATSWAAAAAPTTPLANAHSRVLLGGSEQLSGSRGTPHLAQVLTPPPVAGGLEAETPSPSSSVCQVMRLSRQITPLAAQQLSYTGVPVSAPGGYPVQAPAALQPTSSYCAATANGATQAAAAARAAVAAQVQVQGHSAAWTAAASSSSSCSARPGKLSEAAAQAQSLAASFQRNSRSRPVSGPAQAAAKASEPPEPLEAAPGRPSPLSSHNEKAHCDAAGPVLAAACPEEAAALHPSSLGEARDMTEAAAPVSCIKRPLEVEEPRQLRPHLYQNYPTRGLYV